MRLPILLAAASVSLLVTIRARASDPAAAEALFDDGKRLMAAHDYVRACAKFDESQRLDPGIGTLFHYADCEEHLGKISTAWAAFLEAASDARGQGQHPRESAARARASALEPRVPKLTIDPGAESAVPSLEILRDGTPIGQAQWATALPVDPGPHTIEARAPGKGTWTTTVLAREGMGEVVTIPLLSDAPASPPGEPPSVSTTTTTSAMAESPSRGGGQRAVGIVLTSVGLAGLGVGAGFGIDSLVRHDQSQSHCGARGCDASGVSLRNDARTAGDVSTVAFVGGGAFLLAGILTYVTAPRSTPYIPVGKDARLEVSVGPTGASLSGAW